MIKVSGGTKVCALIGCPVEHSLSPAMHNAAFQHLGLDYIYVAFNVPPERLGDAVLGIKGLGIYGVNVTMPHKINVIKYLDELDEGARLAGSVNTILNRGEKLVGYTTDGLGALRALRHAGVDPAGRKVVILGAGGASRAICFALANHVRELIILNRTLERAVKLADELRRVFSFVGVRAGLLSENVLEDVLKDTDILINATSVGMKPNINETPVKRELLHGNLTVFDIVYEPLETRLLKEAKSVGARTVDGLWMLVYQGALSFEIWTGAKAPVEVMREAALKRLGEKE
ncbi:shikimate dehydrogenase [Candidatus Bathyarchaeota archaeon]|nr:shikimate dehydrogenase [Candidatus Bathyarchaeota archaeon]